MRLDQLRKFALTLRQTTVVKQWGECLVFKVAGKMFAVVALEPARVWIAFKSTPEEFAELTERPGIVPAPYSARYYWVALETKDALSTVELKQQLRRSYDLVFEKLPRRARAELR